MTTPGSIRRSFAWTLACASTLSVSMAQAKGPPPFASVDVYVGERRAVTTSSGDRLVIGGKAQFRVDRKDKDRTLKNLLANASIECATLVDSASVRGFPAPSRARVCFGREPMTVELAGRATIGGLVLTGMLSVTAHPSTLVVEGVLADGAEVSGLRLSHGHTVRVEGAPGAFSASSPAGLGLRYGRIERDGAVAGKVPVRAGDTVEIGDRVMVHFAGERLFGVHRARYYAFFEGPSLALASYRPAAPFRGPLGIELGDDNTNDRGLDAYRDVHVYPSGAVRRAPLARGHVAAGFSLGREDRGPGSQAAVTFWPDGTLQCAELRDRRFIAKWEEAPVVVVFDKKGRPRLAANKFTHEIRGSEFIRTSPEHPLGFAPLYPGECLAIERDHAKALRDWLEKGP